MLLLLSVLDDDPKTLLDDDETSWSTTELLELLDRVLELLFELELLCDREIDELDDFEDELLEILVLLKLLPVELDFVELLLDDLLLEAEVNDFEELELL